MRSLALWASLACLGCGDADVHDHDSSDSRDALTAETSAEISVDALAEALSDVSCPGAHVEGAFAIGHGDCFEAIAAEATVQMVRGIQGGIHVEVRLAVKTTTPHPEMSFEVEVVHDGTSLARFSASNVSLQPLATLDEWATANFPVVFASVDSSNYHGLHVELRARATLAGVPLMANLPIVLAAPPGEGPP